MFNYTKHVTWIEHQVATLGPLVDHQIQRTDKGIPSIRVRLETANCIGELIINEQGKGTLMVAEIKSGRYLLDKHDATLVADMIGCYDEFFRYFS